uniref:Protein tweety homolog n=1 Tax=Caenorhabditis tropicalis TaxID=1561998 RepID=A0A1I7TX36_9PELO
MEKEYDEAKLGNTTCDHGLVMVYLKDTQQLATYRGGDSFVLLGDDDMQKLHKLAAQQGSESDTLAVQYLLANYKQVSEAPIDNWYASWLPVIGLIVAVLVVLCLVSILLSLLCAKCFCCCRKNRKTINSSSSRSKFIRINGQDYTRTEVSSPQKHGLYSPDPDSFELSDRLTYHRQTGFDPTERYPPPPYPPMMMYPPTSDSLMRRVESMTGNILNGVMTFVMGRRRV